MKGKRLLSTLFALCLLISVSASVSAASWQPDITLNESNTAQYAYMDLEAAPASLHDTILEARSRIIYQESWVADGYEGYVTDPDGTVHALPEFHDLFPADWDEPYESGCSEISGDLANADEESSVYLPNALTWTILAIHNNVKIQPPSNDHITNPFYFASRQLTGQVRTEVLKLRDVSTCNLGYTNDFGQSIGHASRLEVGSTFSMYISNVKVRVRTSTYDYRVGGGNFEIDIGR